MILAVRAEIIKKEELEISTFTRLPMNTVAQVEAIKAYIVASVTTTTVSPAVGAVPPVYNLKSKAGREALMDAINAEANTDLFPATSIYEIKDSTADRASFETAAENANMQDIIRINNPYPIGGARDEQLAFVVYGTGDTHAGVIIIDVPETKSYYAILLLQDTGFTSGFDFRRSGKINLDNGRIEYQIVHT